MSQQELSRELRTENTQLKSDISAKAKTIQKTSGNNDLDKLISDVDQKIRMGFDHERWK